MEVHPAAPLIIAHRGASGERPEHTLASYERAIDQGADYIELDLVATRDGALICRHENEISGTTNVADLPEFADRKATKTIDGKPVTGWFTEDFTLAELKKLRARERLPQLRPANTQYDGQYEVPTLPEVLELIRARSKSTKRTLGVYPELKHPTYFRSLGLPLEDRLLDGLKSGGFGEEGAPVFIQCFEVEPLKYLRSRTDLPLILLVGGDAPANLLTPAGLKEVGRFANGIGPEKNLILPRDSNGKPGPPTPLVADAHRVGLQVHAWTFRSENYFLPTDLQRGDATAPDYLRQKGDTAAEYRAFRDTGVDGVFTDFPADAVAALVVRA